MKKVIMLLALCLLLPAMALAECPVTVTGENAADAYSWDETTRTLTIKGNGLTINGDDDDLYYSIVVEPDVTELTVEDILIQTHASVGKSALIVQGDLTLTVQKSLSLSDINYVGEALPTILIENGKTLTVEGSGKFYVDGRINGNLTLGSLSGADTDSIEGNVHVTGGSGSFPYYIWGMKGMLTLSNENALVRLNGNKGSTGETALIGGLNVSAGRLMIMGGYGTATQGGLGMELTADSVITGGEVTIAGGHSRGKGSEALKREGGATLTISGGSLTIKGGAYRSQQDSVSPDYNRPSAALSGENAQALVWESPIQMRTYQYDGSDSKYKDEKDAFGPQDLTGRHVIQSVEGAWVVSYDANGGEGVMPGRIVMDKDPYNIIQTCAFEREGYVFDGWEVIVNGQKMDYMPTITVTADTTIRATWKEMPNYTVRFDANGGSGAMADQKFYIGVAENLTANAFTREGYTFVGWNTKADQTGKAYTDGLHVDNLTMQDGGVVTLYAVWAHEGVGMPGDQQAASVAGSLPQTGDPSCLAGWAALLCASAAGVSAMRRRKH